ncbi:MAG TPA: hypothetical protein VF711_13045 [Acidimicrobiales bacterium]
MRGPAGKALAITAAQDRAFAAFADGQVDGSCRPGDERDGGGFVALAEDAQPAMAAFDAEVLDVNGDVGLYAGSRAKSASHPSTIPRRPCGGGHTHAR